jgi:CheY-like chemotaxis protein
MKILIAEDSLPMRRMIRRVVAGFADEISECGNGSEACVVYAAIRPDWVLMDIEMPDLNGIEATERICAEFPDARIIIVTNYDDPLLREAARRAGALGYVNKENLIDLRRHLQGAGERN